MVEIVNVKINSLTNCNEIYGSIKTVRIPEYFQMISIGNITGTAATGQTLTAGTLNPAGATVTYQWTYCSTSGGTYDTITGATSFTYTIGSTYAGKYIKVIATGIGNYSGIVTSSATSQILPIISINSIGSITGTAMTGQTLTVGALDPSGATATYQWTYCLTSGGTYSNITNATGSTYVIESIYAIKYIKVVATGIGYYIGTVISNATSQILPVTIYEIGDSALGGTIAYILVAGDPGYNANIQKGLVVTSSDLGNFMWCDFYSDKYSGYNIYSNGTAIGTGNNNTYEITFQANGTYFNCAAKNCYSTEVGIYSDWYLPSKDELNKLYLNKNAITQDWMGNYWSSSQSTAGNAWSQEMYNGTVNSTYKRDWMYVRAVRNFTNEITISTTTLYSIGMEALGGKIIYILKEGDPGYNENVQHGLVMSISANGLPNSTHGWGCQGQLIGTSGTTAIGNGNQNTIDICTNCADSWSYARQSSDLSEGEYSDWYLPSKDELNMMYIYDNSIQFEFRYPWTVLNTSNEAQIPGYIAQNNVWAQYMSNDYQFQSKLSTKETCAYYARAIRSF